MRRKIAVIDAETDNFKKGRLIIKPFIWGLYDGDVYKEFYDTEELVDYIYARQYLVYAHNGGKFDYHFLLEYIDRFESILIINNRLAKFKIGFSELRDSYNILVTALSAFKKDDIDYSIFDFEERNKPENMSMIRRYLKSDCVYLYEYVTKFIDKYGSSLTIAGAAVKQWKHISGLDIPEDIGGKIFEKFKPFYFGGRTEAIKTGIIDYEFEMFDINSAYAKAMIHKHPYYLDNFEIDYDEWMALKGDDKGGCFIQLTCVSKGAFPYRRPNAVASDKRLYYPRDNKVREYFVTGWELVAALETKTITDIEIINIHQFIELVSFKQYIDHFYAIKKKAKKEGNRAQELFAKAFLTNLYGKMGANPDKYKAYMTTSHNDINEEGYYVDAEMPDDPWDFSGFMGSHALVSKALYDHEKRFYNLATAASITGYVRAYVWRAICNSVDPLYCDTDSLAARILKNLPGGIGDQVGQWTMEGVFKRAGIAGRKLYVMEHKENTEAYNKGERYKMAHKGVFEISPEQIFKIAEGESIKVVSDRPTFSLTKENYFVSRTLKKTENILID